MRERDEARSLLQNFQTDASHVPVVEIAHPHLTSTDMDTVDMVTMETEKAGSVVAIATEIIDKVNNKCKELSTLRKAHKPVPQGLLSKDSIEKFKEIYSWTPHKTNKGIITCSAVSNDPQGIYEYN